MRAYICVCVHIKKEHKGLKAILWDDRNGTRISTLLLSAGGLLPSFIIYSCLMPFTWLIFIVFKLQMCNGMFSCVWPIETLHHPVFWQLEIRWRKTPNVPHGCQLSICGWCLGDITVSQAGTGWTTPLSKHTSPAKTTKVDIKQNTPIIHSFSRPTYSMLGSWGGAGDSPSIHKLYVVDALIACPLSTVIEVIGKWFGLKVPVSPRLCLFLSPTASKYDFAVNKSRGDHSCPMILRVWKNTSAQDSKQWTELC